MEPVPNMYLTVTCILLTYCTCDCDVLRRNITQRISRLKESLLDLETQMRQHSSAVSYFESLAKHQLDSSNNDDSCIICFEPMTRLTVTPCGHLFCYNCITSCLASNGLCPTCRRAVRQDQLVEVKVAIVHNNDNPK